MITFLTLAYIALLLILIKFKVVRNSKLTWLTIVPYELVLILGFFIPMQWGAPTGSFHTMAYSVPITPNVAGEVTEVLVQENEPVKKGDILFKIDPTQYQAALDGLNAQLALAELRLSQSEELAAKQAGSQYEVQAYRAQVEGLLAQVAAAEYNVRETTVRAPANGFATYVGLRPGARVSNLPLFKSMAFMETDETLFGAQILQNNARHIKPGQKAEVTFKMYPGQVFPAEVMYLISATAQGQVQSSGLALTPRPIQAGPFFVRLKMDDAAMDKHLVHGAVGSVAIYTDKVTAAHVIRKVMIRMEAIANYIVP